MNAKHIKYPGNEAKGQIASLLREMHEQFPNNTGFLLLQAARAARQCGCGLMACPSCGLSKLYQRVRRIENNPRIKTGLLTGGLENQSMA